ncbi:acetyl-CoA synthetase-like protein [Karstenula rhodostoma CBS 690.94]|uniref:Acetyl-CoA synthetase-like protein n=1 Tax=Karstenula rhodostoma CBS 690.94 TaxID=1392251 RepID=A0A9P4U8V2_9PLEO|nr:acetyl-CoA synthetase-like protein [Karstenula rhodostoma CBS 690.94]
MNFAAWALSPVTYDVDKPLLIDASHPEHSVSFNQLKNQVQQLVAGLKAIGIQRGDCVCVNAFNNISYNVLYLGVIGAGAIFTGVNPAYSEHELAHHLNLVGAKVMIVEPSMLEKSTRAAESCGFSKSRIFAFDVHDPMPQNTGVQSWSTLLGYGIGEFDNGCDPEKTVAAYQSSSGTSGLPKAAMIPHSYLISQATLRTGGSELPYEVCRLTPLAPMHAFATPIVASSIRIGSPTYILRRYDETEFIHSIERYHITETWLPPPPILSIAKSPLATKTALQSLRQIWHGGAPLSNNDQMPLQGLLHPEANISPVWGMTEVGWITTVAWSSRRTDDTVGGPLKGFKVRVIDDNGRPLEEPGATGELQILAPHPMLGYLNNAEANKEIFTVDSHGKWVNSGDIGYVTEQCNILIVDRKKDLIKVRGWQVSPSEVESRLRQHPDILDVAVVGVPLGNGLGELVRANVVRRNESMSESEIQQFAAVSLAKYKVPTDIVFSDSIPRNPTGKILRRLLRERPPETGEKQSITKPRFGGLGRQMYGKSLLG